MTSLMVLFVCSLPPLAIAGVALSGLATGRLAILMPLGMTAAVLLIPAVMPVLPAAPDHSSAVRFVPASSSVVATSVAPLIGRP